MVGRFTVMLLAALLTVISVSVLPRSPSLTADTGKSLSIAPVPFAAPSTGHGMLPVAIDGAKTPEKISDRLAYSHFVAAVAETSTPTDKELAMRAAFIDRIKFSKHDYEQFIVAIRGVRDELLTIHEARTQWTTDSGSARSALEALTRAEAQVVENTRLRLMSLLSSEGVTLLERHVRQHVKRHIKIYGEPPRAF